MTIFGPEVSAPHDATPAHWISSRLGDFGTIGGLVPDGFDEYLVVELAVPLDDVSETEQVAAIADVARQHTATPDLIWFGIWEGYGWTNSTTVYSATGRDRRRRRMDDRDRHRRIRHGLEQVPRFDLPGRGYHLVSGPIQAATTISEPGSDRLQLPDLWWPDDRRWFVATDIDLDWTCIGGSTEFIAQMAAAFPDCCKTVQRHLGNNQISSR